MSPIQGASNVNNTCLCSFIEQLTQKEPKVNMTRPSVLFLSSDFCPFGHRSASLAPL